MRLTRQREVIFGALCGTDTHPTAEELLEAVRASEPGLSLATVYNTLDALVDGGLCRRLATPAGTCRYDADTRDHAHAVLDDGRVLDLPPELSRRLIVGSGWVEGVERALGVRVKSLNVQVMVEPREGPRA